MRICRRDTCPEFRRRACTTLLLLMLAACGGGGDTTPPPTATLTGTLAYAISECRENAAGYFLHQAIQIRHLDRDPVTVMEIPDIGPVQPVGLCKFVSSSRYGPNIISQGAVQRIAVSADGLNVAFELTDDFSLLGHDFLPAERQGLFLVRADGSGLRRLGPPSRQSSSLLSPPNFLYFNDLKFSPDGRTLAFPDTGPGPDGVETSQLVVHDTGTGARTPITHFPPPTPGPDVVPGFPGVCCPIFLDNATVGFATEANVNGSNPQGRIIVAQIQTDGTGLKAPPVVALPGSQINPTFVITGDRPTAVTLDVPGEAAVEVFLIDGDNVLQLTRFHLNDTHAGISVDRQTVFVIAAADPFGDNPSRNCQIFSIDRTGANLRQLTHFEETAHSIHGCDFDFPIGIGCAIQLVGQDAKTQALLFYSSCDPLGTNPQGGQIFAMRPDGSDLRQLTDARGLVTEADGTVIGEFPGPFAFSGF